MDSSSESRLDEEEARKLLKITYEEMYIAIMVYIFGDKEAFIDRILKRYRSEAP